jgi:hypothetical protein
VAVFIKGTKTAGTIKERVRGIDWIGIVLFTLSLTAILVGVSWVRF